MYKYIYTYTCIYIYTHTYISSPLPRTHTPTSLHNPTQTRSKRERVTEYACRDVQYYCTRYVDYTSLLHALNAILHYYITTRHKLLRTPVHNTNRHYTSVPSSLSAYYKTHLHSRELVCQFVGQPHVIIIEKRYL